MVSILEYSLHFATVLSRWAREYTNEVGALEVLQKYIPSPSPYPFFGGNPPRRGRGVPKKCTSSRCPRSATKNMFLPNPCPFFGGNPPRRGRGVPKKMHITCRKNAHHQGSLEVLQKIYSLPKILIPIL